MTTPHISPTSRPRTTVYVDGFNLYYGTLAQSPYRWLDLQRFSFLLRPGEEIQTVLYFTAMVDGPTRHNQSAYLRALSTCPLVRVIKGNFKHKTVECLHAECPNPRRRFFTSREEKRTDVNIALRMLDDAYQNRCDRLVLISGDSDLVPALEMVTSRFPEKKISVYIPVPIGCIKGSRARAYKQELRTVATKVRPIPTQFLSRAQLPDPVAMPDGSVVKMPTDWKKPKGPRPPRVCPPIPVGPCAWCGKP